MKEGLESAQRAAVHDALLAGDGRGENFSDVNDNSGVCGREKKNDEEKNMKEDDEKEKKEGEDDEKKKDETFSKTTKAATNPP